MRGQPGHAGGRASDLPRLEPGLEDRREIIMDLISLLVIILIIGLIFYVLQAVPIPDPWRTVAIVIVAIIVILYLLRMLGAVHV